MEQQKVITITLEEYKELLEIKGKYEELKSLYNPTFNPKIIYHNFEDDKELKPPYKITCDTEKISL